MKKPSVKMARGGATTVPIRMAPAYKPPKAPAIPAAMAVPKMTAPKAPPSLATLAVSKNPQMLRKGGKTKKK